MKPKKNFAIALVLFCIVLISYGNIFQNEFAWDDFFFIVDNIHINHPGTIFKFFMEPSTGDLYRPIRSIFYVLTYKVWGINTFGYHLNSLLLHFSVVLLFYFITLGITKKTWISFAASLLFAAHPVHVERITNMTAAFDVFGILFLLLAIFFYIRFSSNGKKVNYISSIMLYFIALFSSEESLILVLILLLYDFSFNYKPNLQNFKMLAKRYLPYIVAALFYLAARFFVVQKVGRADVYFEHSFIGTFLTTVKIFVQYIWILFFPFDITIERVIKFETFPLSLNFIISLLILLAIFFLFIKSYKKSREVFFSLGWFFIALLPFSNLVPQYTIMADRYLYLPSYGFVLFLALAIFWLSGRIAKNHSSAIAFLLVFLIVASYIFVTIKTNFEWKDNFTLLSANLRKSPFGTRINHALALHYRDKGDYKTALEYASKAIQLASKNYNAYENLGTINAYLKNYDGAINYYNKALELNPNFYLALNNLGLVYSYKQDFNNSIIYLKKAIKSNPSLSKSYNDLGTVYGQIGRFDDSIKEINEAIRINPYEPDYYHNLAVIYQFLGNEEEAKKFMLKADELRPDKEKKRSIAGRMQ